jgi:2-polyprenyl-3-methyl-5-hydroxy-6-metoxy-1,4-benzoquinol methylase
MSTSEPTVVRRARKAARMSFDQCDSFISRAAPRGWRHQHLVRRIVARPHDLFRWFDLAEGGTVEIDEQTRALMRGHRLNRSNLYLLRSSNYVEALATPHLQRLAPGLQTDRAAEVVRDALEEIIRWKNVVRCREDHAGGGGYFTAAESVMAWQWENVIFPIIGQCDFTTTLEIGCGHGRNVEFLRKLAKTVVLLDVNDSCLAACRDRFGTARDGCEFRYHRTVGNRLDGVADSSVTLVYSWDTMVHFDKLVVRDYVREIARVLRPGGHAFLHYSNQGAENPNSDCGDNDGHRGDMAPDLFASYARDSGLTIMLHRLSGVRDGWGRDNLDCLTLVQR